MRLIGHKRRKLNEHVYSFLLFVSSRPLYHAECSKIFSNSIVFSKDMATFEIVQEKEGNWTGPEVAIIYGVKIPIAQLHPSFREEDLDHFQTRKDDVFIVSYPKSGE